MMNKRINN